MGIKDESTPLACCSALVRIVLSRYENRTLSLVYSNDTAVSEFYLWSRQLWSAFGQSFTIDLLRLLQLHARTKPLQFLFLMPLMGGRKSTDFALAPAHLLNPVTDAFLYQSCHRTREELSITK